jgi:hypothetical protein
LTDRPALAVPRSARTAADIVALMASFLEAVEGFIADDDPRANPDEQLRGATRQAGNP